jgi:hypothetical protein
MRGHEPLLQMRRLGAKPRMVTLLTTPGFDRWVSTWPALFPEYPEVEIGSDETPERLDLRCLVGLQVRVQGADEQRVERVARAAAAAGAARVIAAVHDEQLDLVRITDTQGALTWPSC